MKFNAQQNGYITEINTFPLKICGREKALHKNSLQKTKAAHCFQVKQKRKNPVKRFTQAMAALSHVLLESLICGFSLRPKDAESYHLLAHLRTPGPSVAITLHTKQDPPRNSARSWSGHWHTLQRQGCRVTLPAFKIILVKEQLRVPRASFFPVK